MTGKKGSVWRKPKVNKSKHCIQLTEEDRQLVFNIAQKKEWSIAKVVYKIFCLGKEKYKT